MLVSLKQASYKLLGFSATDRRRALTFLHESLLSHKDDILKANMRDIEEAQKNQISSALRDRLLLSEKKFTQLCAYPKAIRDHEEVLGKVLSSRILVPGLSLSQMRSPLGLIAFIFESRPDALIQIASLCLKSGNALICKGGREAEQTNTMLFECIKEASTACHFPEWINLIHSRQEVHELLDHDKEIDLVIPRGSYEFVRNIMHTSRIPVLGHADGICHVYLDKYADAKKAKQIVEDSKLQYLAVCNALETLLVHSSQTILLKDIAQHLRNQGVELRGCEQSRNIVPWMKAAEEDDWQTEYLDSILSVKIVDSLDEAIEHITRYGSAHTDVIVSEDETQTSIFIARVDSANVFVNCSTRFSDGYRYGLGAESGISTGKLHARGPVGLEGLTTYKWILRGEGHTVADYEAGKYGPSIT